jgi:hypothetical protein
MMGELSANSQRDARITLSIRSFFAKRIFSLCLNVLKSVKAVSVAAFIDSSSPRPLLTGKFTACKLTIRNCGDETAYWWRLWCSSRLDLI